MLVRANRYQHGGAHEKATCSIILTIVYIPKVLFIFIFVKLFKYDMGPEIKRNYLKIGRDISSSVHWRRDCSCAATCRRSLSAADSLLSLQLPQPSHFSCSAHWAPVNSLLRRSLHGFARDFMVTDRFTCTPSFHIIWLLWPLSSFTLQAPGGQRFRFTF